MDNQVFIRKYGSIYVQRAELLESNRSGSVVNILGKNGEHLSTRLVSDYEVFKDEQAALDDLHRALVVEISNCHFRLMQLRGSNENGNSETHNGDGKAICNDKRDMQVDGFKPGDLTEINPVEKSEVLASV